MNILIAQNEKFHGTTSRPDLVDQVAPDQLWWNYASVCDQELDTYQQTREGVAFWLWLGIDFHNWLVLGGSSLLVGYNLNYKWDK